MCHVSPIVYQLFSIYTQLNVTFIQSKTLKYFRFIHYLWIIFKVIRNLSKLMDCGYRMEECLRNLLNLSQCPF